MLCLSLAFLVAMPTASLKALAYDDAEDFEDANIIKGDVYSTDVTDLKRVSVTNPDIADISDATAT